ncbi:UNVERIFIED_ORG: hypothetical protein M2328_006096 [Rhodococcus erythropolis]
MKQQIPYDEMRRLCGLPDMRLLDLLDDVERYGLANVIMNIIQFHGPIPEYPDEREREVVASLPKPSTSPPMWVRNPAKTRRTAYKPTRRVK